MKRLFWTTIGSAIAALTFATAAHAGPIGPSSLTRSDAVADMNSSVQNVHNRDWRHCHWRNGERYCTTNYRRYNGYGNGYGYYDNGPGITLNFGSSRRYRGEWQGNNFHRQNRGNDHNRQDSLNSGRIYRR